MMTPHSLLWNSLLALLVSSVWAEVDESTYLTVYYNGYEGIQQDPENCNVDKIFPCTITVNDLPLYGDASLQKQSDGYTMDSVCVLREEDPSFYDCTFTVKTPTETITFSGPLNVADSAPDVFDLTDHEGTATLIMLSEETGGLVGKIDIARAPEGGDSAAAGTKLVSIALVGALAFLI